MNNEILKMDDFAAVKDDGDGVLGKILYYSLSNVLIDKKKISEICSEIGFPYTESKRIALSDAFRSATGDIYESKVVEEYGESRTIKIYCRDNKGRRGEPSRELVKETLDARTNRYKKLANITFSKDFGISYSDIAYDEHIDPMDYCLQAGALYEMYQHCIGRKHIETMLEAFIDSLNAVKVISHGKMYFVPRDSMDQLDVFELLIAALEENNEYINPSRTPLDANSMYVVDDEKQRGKMASAYYRAVKKEIEDYTERATHFIQSGSQSPAVMDRWVMKIDGLQAKKREYEGVLQRELGELDDDFKSLNSLALELQIRSRGIRANAA